MNQKRFVFHRPMLAKSIASELAGEGMADYSSGLFLALHRRTGKSTFVREDLIPACEERGWLTVYVDLWANKQVDPGELIANTIAEALTEYDSRFRKLAKKADLDKVQILRTLSWDLSKSKLPAGATLTQALQLLHTLSDKMIVLIVDEAQHALTTDNGVNAMFALKAARDELNQGKASDGIRLVFTGSSRDKLGNLVHKPSSPFFGARITPFRVLGRDFVEAYTEYVNGRMANNNQFQADDMEAAFKLVGSRPEMLAAIIHQIGIDLGAAPDMGRLIREGALDLQEGVWLEYESSYNTLTPVQQAVLEVLAARTLSKKPFAPFATETLDAVSKALETKEHDTAPTTATVQHALNALREKELVWKPSRGEYALEDSGMAEWLTKHRK